MDQLYNKALIKMESIVHLLSKSVPQPQRVPYLDSFFFRHVEKSIFQALVQKLARLVSSLHAARLLMEYGFVQEQASLQRILDEIQEDITFLAYSVIVNDKTQYHQNYLDAFFEEEFDADSAMASTQKRPMVPRNKIRAYIARIESAMAALDPSSGAEVHRTISKAYSGFVHAASPQIMDMYGGDPPKFHMRGMRGTERHQEYIYDLWNYFYRSICVFGLAVKAFNNQALFNDIFELMQEFERQ